MLITEGLKVIINQNVKGCEVVGTAYNGIEGFNYAMKLNPDIIITDIMMPQVNGLEMINKLKEAGCKSKFIILSGYFEFEYAKKGIEQGVKFFINKPVEEEEFKASIMKVFREIDEERAKQQELESLRNAMMGIEHKSDSGISVKKDTITEIKKYISDNFNKEIGLAEISSRFYMNPSYLSQLFKEKTGETFLNYIMKIRINKAKELLQNTDMKIYEICEYVGYSDTNYFSKLFEKLEGCRPSEYKKRR